MTKYIKCYFCGEKIHISKYSGEVNINGEAKSFCNNILCIIQLINLKELKYE